MYLKKLIALLGAALLTLVTLSVGAASVSPQAIDGAKTADAAMAKALFDKEVVFVDVRKSKDWDAGRIPGAVHLDVKSKLTAEALAKEVEKSAAVVIYCNGEKCKRSSKASAMAVSWGFKNVYYFRGGFPAWQAAGYPVE